MHSQWDVVEATLTDGAGNTVTVNGDSLTARVRGPTSFKVMNANLTFWAEDLFDYAFDETGGEDDYSSFYTEYGDDY
jgi:hypothetical protein